MYGSVTNIHVLVQFKTQKIEKCVLYPLKQRLMKGLTNSCLGWFIYPMDTGASTCSDHWCSVSSSSPLQK